MERIGTKIVIGLSLFMGLALTVGSFFVTYQMKDLADGTIVCSQENALIPVVLFGVLSILGIFFLLLKKGHFTSKSVYLTEIAVMLWMGLFSIWWVMAADRMPTDDQAYIYGFASYFLEGDYTGCMPGGYLSLYPHQVGLIAFTQLFFGLVGAMNYQAVQILNICFLVATIPVMRRLSEILFESIPVTVYSLLLTGACLPLCFYTPYVYGEIPSIFFVLLLLFFAIRLEKKGKTKDLCLLTLAATAAYLCRNMRMIFLIAVFLYFAVMGLSRKKKKFLIAAVLVVAVPYGAGKGILHIYESLSGYALNNGLPSILWICMGLQEGNMGAGWFNNYPVRTFIDSGYDREVATQMAKTVMGIRFRDLTHPISYGVTYFARKFLSEWANPSYNGLESNYQYLSALSGTAYSLRYGMLKNICYAFMDIWQVTIYLFFTLGVWMRRKRKELSSFLPEIVLIGGVLISIIWEANSRYIFSYALTLIPVAAYGIRMLFWQVSNTKKKTKTEETNEKA